MSVETLQQAVNETEAKMRQSRVINRNYVRRWALEYAKAHRAHKFTRVSESFLNDIESGTKCYIARRIESAPSKGKTLQ